jgi:hypothetical protein
MDPKKYPIFVFIMRFKKKLLKNCFTVFACLALDDLIVTVCDSLVLNRMKHLVL